MYLKKLSLTLKTSDFAFIFLNNNVILGCGHTKSTCLQASFLTEKKYRVALLAQHDLYID